MTNVALEARGLARRYGELDAVADFSLTLQAGEVCGLIGPNGAGKTTLFNVISGIYKPTEGHVRFAGQAATGLPRHRMAPLGLGRTFQNLALFGHMSVLENIMVGRHHLLRSGFLSGMAYWLGGAQQEELRHRREVEEIIDFLQIQHIRKAHAGTLSYGLRKRVELARAVALRPKLILLDEPMAGMNLEEKEDMARTILDLNEEWGMTILMIEHDMGVVMDISHRVMVLDFGRKLTEGRPEEVMAHPAVRQAYLGEADAAPSEAVPA